MSLSLDVRPELQDRVREEAQRLNMDPGTLLSEIIDASLMVMDFEGANRDVTDPNVAGLILRAYQDPLTSLASLRTFYMQLERQWQESATTGAPLALLMLDVDNFKRINDREGHGVGDQLLKQIAKALVHHTRAQDYVARFAGDEFIILLPGTDATGAAGLIETLNSVLHNSFSDKSQPVTVSFGLAEAPPFSGNAHDFLRRADDNLYQEKAKNRKGSYEDGVLAIRAEQRKQTEAQKERAERNAHLIARLRSFSDGDPEQQKQDLAALQAGLEEARPGQRRLFGEGFNP